MVCSKHICEVISRLANVVQASIFKDENGSNPTTIATEHASNENPDITALSDQELEASINSLKQEILNLTRPPPSGNATYSVRPIPNTKQPHCTVCGHIVKSHEKSKDQEKFCRHCNSH